MAILRAVSPDRLKHAAVLEAVKVRPGNAGVAATAEWRPTLTASARVGVGSLRSGRKNARGAGRTKEWTQEGKVPASGNARFLIRGSSRDGQAWPLQPLPPSLRGFRPPFTDGLVRGQRRGLLFGLAKTDRLIVEIKAEL